MYFESDTQGTLLSLWGKFADYDTSIRALLGLTSAKGERLHSLKDVFARCFIKAPFSIVV